MLHVYLWDLVGKGWYFTGEGQLETWPCIVFSVKTELLNLAVKGLSFIPQMIISTQFLSDFILSTRYIGPLMFRRA